MQSGWVRRQTQVGVDGVESIDHLIIAVSEWMSGDWCTHVSVSVCVCCLLYTSDAADER